MHLRALLIEEEDVNGPMKEFQGFRVFRGHGLGVASRSRQGSTQIRYSRAIALEIQQQRRLLQAFTRLSTTWLCERSGIPLQPEYYQAVM